MYPDVSLLTFCLTAYELSCSDCAQMMPLCYCHFVNDCEDAGCGSGDCDLGNCVEFHGGED